MEARNLLNKIEQYRQLRKQRQIEQQEVKAKEIRENMINNIQNSFYYYITSIESPYVFFYITIFLIIFVIFRRLEIKLGYLFAMFIGVVVVYFINDRKRVIEFTQGDKLKIKLESLIPKPKYFNFKPEFIHFFYNIREFRSYNDQAFDTMIENTDIILRIHQDILIGVKECEQNIDVVIDKTKDIMNTLHSYIYKIPVNNVAKEKLKKAMKVLQILLKKEIDDMIDLCNQQLEQNRSPKLITYQKIKATNHDELDINHFDMYK